MPTRHPVVGSWLVSLEPDGEGDVPSMLLIRPSLDGGVAAVVPPPVHAAADLRDASGFWSTAIGEWKEASETAARIVAVTLGVDGAGAAIGRRTLTVLATVDPAGSTWSGRVQLAANGATTQGSHHVTWAARGVRVVADENTFATEDRPDFAWKGIP